MDYLLPVIKPLAFLPLLGLLCAALIALLTFDELVKLEYQEHYDEWVQDGKPDGFWWCHKESTWLRSSLARNKVSFYWLFVTPEWIKLSAQAKRLLRRLRICVAIWNLGIIISLAIAYLLSVQ
jgi:hypothetical protein